MVASRLPVGRSIVHPPSACPSCDAPIAPRDNIPVRLVPAACAAAAGAARTRIGWQYPAVELLTALLVAACVLAFGLTFEAAIAAFFCAALVAVSVIDIERFVIPNRIVLPAAASCSSRRRCASPSPEWAIAGLGAALFLLLAALAYPAGMGMGDVKLALLLGFVLGRTVPVAMMIGMSPRSCRRSCCSPATAARPGRCGSRSGPFLALGGVVALFAGDRILDAYLGVM